MSATSAPVVTSTSASMVSPGSNQLSKKTAATAAGPVASHARPGVEPLEVHVRGQQPSERVAVLGRDRPGEVLADRCRRHRASRRRFPSVAPGDLPCAACGSRLGSRCWTGTTGGRAPRPTPPGSTRTCAPHLARRADAGEAPGPRLPVHLLLPAPGPAAPLAPGLRRRGWPTRRSTTGCRGYAVGRERRRPDARRVAACRCCEALANGCCVATAVATGRHLGCFGLHEWAMVYRLPETRRGTPTGRCGWARPAPTTVVESHRIACSHFDAFRFFTEPARRSTRSARPRRPGRRSSSRGACTPGWTSTSTPSG